MRLLILLIIVLIVMFIVMLLIVIASVHIVIVHGHPLLISKTNNDNTKTMKTHDNNNFRCDRNAVLQTSDLIHQTCPALIYWLVLVQQQQQRQQKDQRRLQLELEQTESNRVH